MNGYLKWYCQKVSIQKSEKYAKNIVRFNFGLIAGIWLALFILVFFIYDWNLMEPWTYFVGSGAVLLSYGYFAITLKNFNPFKIYAQIAEKKRLKIYEELGINSDKFESFDA